MLGQEKLTESCPGLGNIIGPLTFRGKDAPDYIPAKIAIVVTTAFACCMTALLMAYYTYENKRRDGLMSGVEHQENSEFLDLTDKENLEFRVSFLPALIHHSVLTQATVPVINSGMTAPSSRRSERLIDRIPIGLCVSCGISKYARKRAPIRSLLSQAAFRHAFVVCEDSSDARP